MFGIGMTEIVVILVIALLIFGPNKLPELARSLGRGFGEFRRASYELRQSLVDAAEPDPPPRTQTAYTPKVQPPPEGPRPAPNPTAPAEAPAPAEAGPPTDAPAAKPEGTA